jgi:hypothetical protein
MSRFSGNDSYRHRWRDMGDGCYRVSWTKDYYYPDSRLRFPRICERDTDLKGVLRFCKKYNIQPPIIGNLT